jgi:uncharacterized damage-inducible protein DinB
MTILQSFTKELEKEGAITRKMLERVPTEKFNWQPHEKSMSIQKLATHVAEIPGWIGWVLTTTELDFANTDYKPASISNNVELMDYFEKNLVDARAQLAKANEEQLSETWTMRNGDQVYDVSPKDEVIRGAFCQVVHHRAQLGVYLRLLNIPIPGSYGPSADDESFS